MKKLSRIVASRQFVLSLMLLLNIAFFVLTYIFVGAYLYLIIGLVAVFGMAFVINLHNENPEHKIIWALLMVLMPFFAVSAYVYSKSNHGSINERKRSLKITYKSSQLLVENRDIKAVFEGTEPEFKRIEKYIYSTSLTPINANNEVTYYKNGASYVEEALKVMDSARKYIFLEFNRVEDGKVWADIFKIMREKARLDVEVILLYDDASCQKGFKDKRTFLKLANHKIKAIPFNETKWFSPASKYKTNRSLVIVDGMTALTGSVNISDAYLNMKDGDGVQKDCGVKLSGDVVWSMVVTFLNHYQLASNISMDISKYKENIRINKNKNFVQSFVSSPLLSNNCIARDLYSQMINLAGKTVYITSPYIVLDDEMRKQLKIAGQSGVDVRLVLSSRGKGRILSQTYYVELIKAGVKVYEYEDGIMNSRMCIADDSCAIIGTVPFDFRKTINNAENGVVIYGKQNVLPASEDFNDILSHSKLITLRDLKKRKTWHRIWGQVLRFFALMY